MNKMKQAVFSALEKLNWKYGRGEIVQVYSESCYMDNGWIKGFFVRKPFQCRVEIRRFRLMAKPNNSVTVHALGHQTSININAVSA